LLEKRQTYDYAKVDELTSMGWASQIQFKMHPLVETETYIHENNVHYEHDEKHQVLQRDQNRVKLLTQNMFMLPKVPGDKFVLKDMRALEFSRNIMPKYDIICLCEVFHSWFLDGRKNLIIDLSKRNGYSHFA